MVNLLTKIIAFFALAILEVTLVPYFGVSGVWPNLVLVVIISLMLFDRNQDAYLLAGIGGVALDLAGSWSFGLYTLILVGLSVLVGWISRKFLTEPNFLTAALINGLVGLIFSFILNLLLHEPLNWFFLIEFAFNAVLGSLFFLIFSRVLKSNQAIKVAI